MLTLSSILFPDGQELEMFSEVSKASESMSKEVSQLQTQPRYWSGQDKRTLRECIFSFTCTLTHTVCCMLFIYLFSPADQLEELTSRYRDFLTRHQPNFQLSG